VENFDAGKAAFSFAVAQQERGFLRARENSFVYAHIKAMRSENDPAV
jgi:hypothetical protein